MVVVVVVGGGGDAIIDSEHLSSSGVRQVQEVSGEQRKMEETDCEIIYGAPTTLTVKG